MATPLRGRDDELSTLREHLGRLRGGAGFSWLIEGGAGLGKSRLVEYAVSAGRGAGFAVGHGLAAPADAAVQLAALADALFAGPGPVLNRSALRDSPAPVEQRYWLLQDIQELLEQAALRQPVLICLDDLQWADSGTAAALRSLPARLATLPVGWVLALRPAEAGSDVSRAVTDLLRGGATRTELRRLGQPAVAEVTADFLGGPPDAALLTLAGSAHGNPFLLMELLSGLRNEHPAEIRAGSPPLVGTQLPRRFRDSLQHRLGRMSPAARKAAAV